MACRTVVGVLISAVLAIGLVAVPREAAALDVYTEPGIHQYNGRRWRTTCASYSSTIERCRTEIWATTVSYSGGRYAERAGWAFNNLTYKPSRRDQWVGNILAIPGEHVLDGRRWRTECDTSWTGQNACRSSILATVYARSGSGYAARQAWVFNNIVRFTLAPAEPFCVSPAVAPVPGATAAGARPAAQPGPAAGPSQSPDLGGGPDPEPSPEPTASPESTPSPEPTASPDPTPSPEPTTTPDPEPIAPAVAPSPADLGPATVPDAEPAPIPPVETVTVAEIAHPDRPGSLYDNLGPIRVTGKAPAGAQVSVDVRDAGGRLRSTTTVPAKGGSYSALVDGGFTGRATLLVRVAGEPTVTRVVDLLPATLTQSMPTSLDPLVATAVTGRLTPAVGDSLVTAYVSTPSGWFGAGSARVRADGSYTVPFTYGRGTLGTLKVRTCVTLPWGHRFPAAAATSSTRIRTANPVITNTTTAEVAGTWRPGCPVGPSNLSTIRINQQTMTGMIYRGEIIVRRDRAADVTHAFTKALEAGFPVYQMTNPNAFGGNDVASMASNNTSAFNCRKVVGNPYAMSPHSYGYAVDLNPWQNPYRDPKGVWYPSTQHVVRTPVVPGMLTTGSAPVAAFRSRGWKWFSGWDWHHFEKR